MSKNFPFFNLNKKVIALAPIDGYTDCAFREIICDYGKPDLMFTEFVNAQGLIRATYKLIEILRYTERERPIIAQLFGKEPEYSYQAAMLLCELGFDGIDINMGCPAKHVASSGGGAALIKTPKLAVELIKVVKKAVGDYKNGSREYYGREDLIKGKQGEWRIKENSDREITVSVKTRIGYEKEEMAGWLEWLVDGDPDFITIHGRTLKQMYKGKADWGSIKRAVELTDIPIIGNGDIGSMCEAEERMKVSGSAGGMIGRAAIGRPWIFKSNTLPEVEADFDTIKKAALRHAELYVKYKGEKKFYEMRKILLEYFKGFDRAKDLRIVVSQVNSLAELEKKLGREL